VAFIAHRRVSLGCNRVDTQMRSTAAQVDRVRYDMPFGGSGRDARVNLRLALTGGLAQMLAPKGIRANAVAPGPIWTPLIPSTMQEDAVQKFGKQVPLQRAGPPPELATAYVMLADPLSSYTSGTTVAITGGKPFI
jgi:enoyl-ACP reductase-like protein